MRNFSALDILPTLRAARALISDPRGYQSPEQKMMQATIERAGGLYFVVRGGDDAANIPARLS